MAEKLKAVAAETAAAAAAAAEVTKTSVTKKDLMLWRDADMNSVSEKRRKILLQRIEKSAEELEAAVKEAPSFKSGLAMDFKGIYVRPNKRPSSSGKENKHQGLLLILPEILTMAVNPKLARKKNNALYVSVQSKTAMSEARKTQWNEMQASSASSFQSGAAPDAAQQKSSEKTEKQDALAPPATTSSTGASVGSGGGGGGGGGGAKDANHAQRKNDIVVVDGDEIKLEPYQLIQFNVSTMNKRPGLRFAGDKPVPNFCYLHLHNVEIMRIFNASKYGDGTNVFITAESVSRAQPDKEYYEARRLLLDFDPSVYVFPEVNFEEVRHLVDTYNSTPSSSSKSSSELVLTEDMTPRYGAMKNLLGDKKMVVVTSTRKTKLYDVIRNKLPLETRSLFSNYYTLPFSDTKRYGSGPVDVFDQGHVCTFFPPIIEDYKDTEKSGDVNVPIKVLRYTQPVVQYTRIEEDDVATTNIVLHIQVDPRQCSLMLGIATLEMWEVMAPVHMLELWRTKLVTGFTLGYTTMLLENGDTRKTHTMHLNGRVKSVISALPEYICQRLIPITHERAILMCYGFANTIMTAKKLKLTMDAERLDLREVCEHTDAHLNALNEETDMGVRNVMESNFNVDIGTAEKSWDFYVMMEFGPLKLEHVVALYEDARSRAKSDALALASVKTLFSEYFESKAVPAKLLELGITYLPNISTPGAKVVVFAVDRSVTKRMSPFYNPAVLAEMKAEIQRCKKETAPEPHVNGSGADTSNGTAQRDAHKKKDDPKRTEGREPAASSARGMLLEDPIKDDDEDDGAGKQEEARRTEDIFKRLEEDEDREAESEEKKMNVDEDREEEQVQEPKPKAHAKKEKKRKRNTKKSDDDDE